jgi:hypothetical protein
LCEEDAKKRRAILRKKNTIQSAPAERLNEAEEKIRKEGKEGTKHGTQAEMVGEAEGGRAEENGGGRR